VTTNTTLRIAIIGAGPGGLAAGHELLDKGFTNFTLFEATDAVGGTWHIHTYPGLACDVWAHSYTFSYRPNPDWTANFVEQPEIEQYLQTCALEFGLTPHIKLNTRIASAVYQDGGSWRLTSERGETFECDVVINAMGNQHTPLYPDVPGKEDFAGNSFHGTRWDHTVELRGKRVVVVGSAASAVQIVPEIAKVVGHLTVLQRSANWIMPRRRKLYSDAKRNWFRRLPLLIRLTQRFQRFLMSFVLPAVTIGHKRMKDFEKLAKRYLDSVIPEGAMRDALTPDSQYGCKRGLVSDDFYPALMRENTELVHDGLGKVRPEGITTSGGREIDVDVIIYCTGYRILDFDRINVVGENSQTLAAQMSDTPEAHKGIAAPGFPNYFFAVGPNGLVLDTPYFMTVEKNLETIVRLLIEKEAAGLHAIAVKPDLHRAYNDWMEPRFPLYSWGNEACSSYYRTASGRVPFLYPGSFKDYTKMHAAITLEEFESR
jgi:cyclohexanone monooxygenase